MSTKTTRDCEQAGLDRKAKVEALNAELVAAVESLTDSARWRRMLEISAPFVRTQLAVVAYSKSVNAGRPVLAITRHDGAVMVTTLWTTAMRCHVP